MTPNLWRKPHNLTKRILNVLGVATATILLLLAVKAFTDRNKTMCSDLAVRMEVWKMCDPQIGCMATYHDALQLSRDLNTCKELGIAP